MLDHEIINAVLQGLPTSFLARLGNRWLAFCQRIEFALSNQEPPLSALKFALEKTNPHIVQLIARFLKETQRVAPLPSFTRRQKEVLVVLRTFGPGTCAQLSRVLSQDRSHTHKRLKLLVASGLVAKFHRWDGVYYLASRIPLDSLAADQVYEFFERLANSANGARTDSGAQDPQPAAAHPVAANPPIESHATTATNATSATSAMPPPGKSSHNFLNRRSSIPTTRRLYSLKNMQETNDRLPESTDHLIDRLTNRPID
jgi:hypothetical protein